MRTLMITTLATAVLFLSDPGPPAQAASPAGVGGFTLNSPIENYPVERHANYLNEVIVTGLPGYHKGFITYGTCATPGRILRIKLKYEDRSYAFFEELLARYKEKFGAKPKFSGDQFGNLKSWKWWFTDAEGQQVTLELQHNLKDSDESIGNMVKLSLPGRMDEERHCFNDTYAPEGEGQGQQGGGSPDWSLLIPN